MSASRLAKTLVSRLAVRGWWVATAESCTGGLIGGALTSISGSSAVVRGGLIAYSNEVKMAQLGVEPAILEEFGAVSPETARAMATGCRSLFDVDLALSVTGVAGPEGGSPAKPVGLVYLGAATPEEVVTRRHIFPGDRAAVRQASVDAALDLGLGLL